MTEKLLFVPKINIYEFSMGQLRFLDLILAFTTIILMRLMIPFWSVISSLPIYCKARMLHFIELSRQMYILTLLKTVNIMQTTKLMAT
jgi:hypothetical protein